MVIDQLIDAATYKDEGPTSRFDEYDFASLIIRETLKTLADRGLLNTTYCVALKAVNDQIMEDL